MPHANPAARLLPSALLPVALLAGCGSFKSEREMTYEHTLTSTGPVTLDVQTDNGAISIEAAPGTRTLKVISRQRARGNSQGAADARVATFDVSIQEDADGKIVIRPILPKPRQSGDMVGLQVMVPELAGAHAVTDNGQIHLEGATAKSTLYTDNGRVSALGCSADLQIETDNGRVTVQDCSGALQVETDNGRIGIEAHSGPVVAYTDNGRITLKLAGDASHTFQLKSDNGRIEVDAPATWNGRVVARSGNGSIRHRHKGEVITNARDHAVLTLGQGNSARDAKGSTAQSGNGSITIRQN